MPVCRLMAVLPNKLPNYKRIFAIKIVNSKISKRNLNERKPRLLKHLHS